MNRLYDLTLGFSAGLIFGIATALAATADHQCEPIAIETEAVTQTEIPHIVLETEPTTEETEAAYELISLGEFRVTAYCSCEICCGQWSKYNKTASGTTPEQGRTIAVDKNQIPLGTEIVIDGHVYIAEDTGSAIKKDCIDIYFNDHQVAKEFGVQYKQVFVRR